MGWEIRGEKAFFFLRVGQAPAEFFQGEDAGAPAPQVHGQLARDGDDGFFARGARGFARASEDFLPVLNEFAVRLPFDHAPGQHDQRTIESACTSRPSLID